MRPIQWCRLCQILWDIPIDPQISCDIPTSWNISKQPNIDSSLAHYDSTQAHSSLQWGWCSESQLWSCQLFQIFLITFLNIVGYSYFEMAKIISSFCLSEPRDGPMWWCWSVCYYSWQQLSKLSIIMISVMIINIMIINIMFIIITVFHPVITSWSVVCSSVLSGAIPSFPP